MMFLVDYLITRFLQSWKPQKYNTVVIEYKYDEKIFSCLKAYIFLYENKSQIES